MSKPNVIAFGSCVLLLTCLIGCKKQMVKDLVVDPEFSRGALSHGTLAVAGVTNNIGGGDLDTAFAFLWGNRLRSALKRKVDFCDIADGGYFQSLVEKSRGVEIMRTYHDKHQLTAAELAELHLATGDKPVFLVCGRFVSSDVNQSRRTDKEDTTRNTTELTFRTQREIKARFHVYDIQKERLVWNGVISDAASNKNHYRVPLSYDEEEVDESLFEEVMNVIFSDDDEPEEQVKLEYPKAPTFEDVALKVLVEFARYMPPKEE